MVGSASRADTRFAMGVAPVMVAVVAPRNVRVKDVVPDPQVMFCTSDTVPTRDTRVDTAWTSYTRRSLACTRYVRFSPTIPPCSPTPVALEDGG